MSASHVSLLCAMGGGGDAIKFPKRAQSYQNLISTEELHAVDDG